jgi:hypothetical protein
MFHASSKTRTERVKLEMAMINTKVPIRAHLILDKFLDINFSQRTNRGPYNIGNRNFPSFCIREPWRQVELSIKIQQNNRLENDFS